MSEIKNITTTSKYAAALKKISNEPFTLLYDGKHVVDFTSKLCIVRYTLNIKDKVIAEFTLVPMIGCCGICVSTRASVIPEYRGKGLGTLLNLLRIDIAREAGYSILLCTDIEKNEYQRKILRANGWRDLTSFINKRTKNHVYISCINL